MLFNGYWFHLRIPFILPICVKDFLITPVKLLFWENTIDLLEIIEILESTDFDHLTVAVLYALTIPST